MASFTQSKNGIFILGILAGIAIGLILQKRLKVIKEDNEQKV